MSTNNNWVNFFPYSSPREKQVEAILAGISCLNNKKYFILEAGTGVGKSAIGLTVSKAIDSNMQTESEFGEGAYFLTTQKILQQQYVKDFSAQ